MLICRGHGNDYQGSVVGWEGNKTRVGGVIVSKQFFASDHYDMVMKIGAVKRKIVAQKTLCGQLEWYQLFGLMLINEYSPKILSQRSPFIIRI